MARSRLASPSRDGELLVEPPYSDWPESMREASARFAEWDTVIGGLDARVLRDRARASFVDAAVSYTRGLGLGEGDVGASERPIVVTGHQPELFHPGVWVKVLLAEGFAREVEATAVDLVVDTDAFESVGVRLPVLDPELGSRWIELAPGVPQGCYACAGPLDAEAVERFRADGESALGTLGQDELVERFSAYCEALTTARADGAGLAESLTAARRRYEDTGAEDYLELASSRLAETDPFRRFVAHVALDAHGYATIHNEELARYRHEMKLRSAARPFPDLEIDGETVEIPFWAVGETRASVRARTTSRGVELLAGDVVIELPADPDRAVACLRETELVIAPKAIALTLYVRAFVADLFIHGVGGAHYDRVTEAVAQRYLGVELPPHAVASLTMHVSLTREGSDAAELPRAKERLNRLSHNPDSFVAEAEFANGRERERAEELADRKRQLVEAIAAEGADKKALGREIREVNDELASVLQPVRTALEAEVARLEQVSRDEEVRTDRTYPFFLWSPDDVRDKAR